MSDENAVAKPDPAQEYWFKLGLRTVWLSADGIRDQANGGVSVDQQEFERLVAEHNGLLERLKADHGILEQLTADYKVSYG